MNVIIEFILVPIILISYLVRNWSIDNCKIGSKGKEYVSFIKFLLNQRGKVALVRRELFMIKSDYPMKYKLIANSSTAIFILSFIIVIGDAFINTYFG